LQFHRKFKFQVTTCGIYFPGAPYSQFHLFHIKLLLVPTLRDMHGFRISHRRQNRM
jgi:hypothetical protein